MSEQAGMDAPRPTSPGYYRNDTLDECHIRIETLQNELSSIMEQQGEVMDRRIEVELLIQAHSAQLKVLDQPQAAPHRETPNDTRPPAFS